MDKEENYNATSWCTWTCNYLYDDGFRDGNATGYDLGYKYGKADGLTIGYGNGYDDGYYKGFKQGNNQGYNDGYYRGYQIANTIFKLNEVVKPLEIIFLSLNIVFFVLVFILPIIIRHKRQNIIIKSSHTVYTPIKSFKNDNPPAYNSII